MQRHTSRRSLFVIEFRYSFPDITTGGGALVLRMGFLHKLRDMKFSSRDNVARYYHAYYIWESFGVFMK